METKAIYELIGRNGVRVVVEHARMKPGYIVTATDEHAREGWEDADEPVIASVHVLARGDAILRACAYFEGTLYERHADGGCMVCRIDDGSHCVVCLVGVGECGSCGVACYHSNPECPEREDIERSDDREVLR